MSFELNWHQWWDRTFQGQPCSCPLLWLVPFLPSVYFTLLCRKWLHRSATITLALPRKEITLKLDSCFSWCCRGLWHFFVIADKKWIIYSYHSQVAKLFLPSQRYCPLFSLSLYLVWHFKKPSLMTACSINCVAQFWHVDVIWGIMKAVTSQDNHHADEPCRFKLRISQLPLAGTL